jgi:FMN phosphatase YigB (HAD superfamily)
MIGDSRRVDFDGALAAGWRAILVRGERDGAPLWAADAVAAVAFVSGRG